MDLDDQIIDKEFAAKGLSTWFQDWANVRQMHSGNLPPAGTAVEMEPRPDGMWVRTHVYEPGAVLQVKNGGYKAYSVGISRPRIIRDGVAKGGRVVGGIFSEISLVDFPANPRSKFQLAKRAKIDSTSPIQIVEKTVAAAAELTKAVDDDAPVTFKPSDLVEMLRKHGKVPLVAKRDTDPDVDGGVDRDKLPAEDFAGRNRSFPIHTPDDVSDAATSIGRAGDDNYGPDQLKTNIIRIAHRKGTAFEAELPESWKDGSTTTKTTTVPAVTKAEHDEPCGTCVKGKIREGHVDCPDCGGSGKAKDVKKAAVAPVVVKGARDCGSCGKQHDSDSDHKFCSGCGSKLPAKGAVKADAAKSGGLQEHREPDGDEAGPDVDGDGDGNTAADDNGDGRDDRIGKAAGVTYHLTRVHDALCAAYQDPDVLEAHPSLAKGIPAVIDPEVWAATLSKALSAPAGQQVWQLAGMSDAYAMASTLAAADPELLEQAMGDLRKAFAEYYPDAHPTPRAMNPATFKRPYVGTGHASQSAKAGQKPRIPMATHVPDPADFRRPLLTSGHESASPSSMSKGRTYYTTAAKEHATGLLTQLHDYVVEQHPGVCPMHGPTPDGEPALAGSAGSTLTRAVAASATMDMQPTAIPTEVPAGRPAEVVTKSVDLEAIHAMVAEVLKANTDLQEEVQSLGKRLGDLESAPDPATAGYRGSATTVTKAATDPAGRESDEAERLVGLVKRARNADTSVSQPAITQLVKSVGIDGTAELLK